MRDKSQTSKKKCLLPVYFLCVSLSSELLVQASSSINHVFRDRKMDSAGKSRGKERGKLLHLKSPSAAYQNKVEMKVSLLAGGAKEPSVFQGEGSFLRPPPCETHIP